MNSKYIFGLIFGFFVTCFFLTLRFDAILGHTKTRLWKSCYKFYGLFQRSTSELYDRIKLRHTLFQGFWMLLRVLQPSLLYSRPSHTPVHQPIVYFNIPFNVDLGLSSPWQRHDFLDWQQLKYWTEHGNTCHEVDTLQSLRTVGTLRFVQTRQSDWQRAVSIYLIFDIGPYLIGCFWGTMQMLNPKLII